VVNVSQLLTVTKRLLTARVQEVSRETMTRVDDGLRSVLGL